MTEPSALTVRSMIVLSMPLLMGCPALPGAEARTRWVRPNWRGARSIQKPEATGSQNASAPRERLHWVKTRPSPIDPRSDDIRSVPGV
jgi:hypothetical protein